MTPFAALVSAGGVDPTAYRSKVRAAGIPQGRPLTDSNLDPLVTVETSRCQSALSVGHYLVLPC